MLIKSNFLFFKIKLTNFILAKKVILNDKLTVYKSNYALCKVFLMYYYFILEVSIILYYIRIYWILIIIYRLILFIDPLSFIAFYISNELSNDDFVYILGDGNSGSGSNPGSGSGGNNGGGIPPNPHNPNFAAIGMRRDTGDEQQVTDAFRMEELRVGNQLVNVAQEEARLRAILNDPASYTQNYPRGPRTLDVTRLGLQNGAVTVRGRHDPHYDYAGPTTSLNRWPYPIRTAAEIQEMIETPQQSPERTAFVNGLLDMYRKGDHSSKTNYLHSYGYGIPRTRELESVCSVSFEYHGKSGRGKVEESWTAYQFPPKYIGDIISGLRSV